MRRATRYLIYLLALALGAFAIYAAVADLPPSVRPVTMPAPAPGGG